MKRNICFFVILLFSITGCSSSRGVEVNDALSKNHKKCEVRSGVLLKGQIRLFHDMNLKYDSCPSLANEEWDFEHVEDLNKIWEVLNPKEYLAYSQYVDIEFYAKKTRGGKVLIEHIVSAEKTKESQYKDEP